MRLGLLSFATALFVSGILRLIPFTLEFSRWNAAASNWSLGLLAALAVFGFYASRAGQPLFGPVLND